MHNVKTITVTEKKEYALNPRILVNNRTCIVCRQPFNYSDWLKSHGRYQSQVDNNCCNDCQIWARVAVFDRAEQPYIIDGEHYYTGAKLEDYIINQNDTLGSIAKSFTSRGISQGKGMGGSKHVIRMFRAKIVITDDLWHQGTVPEYFTKSDQANLDVPAFIRRAPMKNNAEFVSMV